MTIEMSYCQVWVAGILLQQLIDVRECEFRLGIVALSFGKLVPVESHIGRTKRV